MPIVRHCILAASAICLTLILASCSQSTSGSGVAAGGSSPAASGASSSAASSTSTTAASASAPAGQAKLAAIALQTADLPTGWTGADWVADPADAGDQAALVKCVGARDTTPDQVAVSHSQDFSSDDDATISSQATSFKTDDDVKTDTALLQSSKINSCYQTLARTEIGSTLPAGATIDSLTITVTPGTNGGPSNVVGEVSGQINVTDSGQTISVFLSSFYMTGPRIEAEIDFVSPGQPVDAGLQAQLVTTVAKRAAAG